MAASWQTIFPSNWAFFSISIQEYAQELVARSDFQLPKDLTFRHWFKINEQSLRADQYQRAKNGLIALKLLSLVEDNPGNWESIRFIPDCEGAFGQLLSEWKNKCPEPQKRFIEEISDVFGVKTF